MNKKQIRDQLASATSDNALEEKSFRNMETKEIILLEDFLEQIYVSDKFSYVRIDLFDRDGIYDFRISGFQPISDLNLKEKGIFNIFYLGSI